MLAILMMSCHPEAEQALDPYESLPQNEAGEIVKKAIQQAGGWDSWKDKDNFSFYKKITHLDSSGTIEKSVKQHHTYQLRDGFKARMEWSVGDDDFLIINNGEVAKKYKNGEELTNDRSKNEAWNSSYGSHYVIAMPYKLTDPGVTLTYDGIDTTLFNKPVHAIMVEYAKGAGSTGGMHLWYYYFDVDDFDLAGNYLDYGEGHSITSYEVFEEVDNHVFHNKRFSYISNADKEKVMLRTIYENEDMKFDQVLNKDLFDLK